jgi:hypothetical protein
MNPKRFLQEVTEATEPNQEEIFSRIRRRSAEELPPSPRAMADVMPDMMPDRQMGTQVPEIQPRNTLTTPKGIFSGTNAGRCKGNR